MSEPTSPILLPGGAPLHFQRIPRVGAPGLFRLGERGLGDSLWGFTDPVVGVKITRPFFMATCPVTQGQFREWTQAEGIEHKNDFDGPPDLPAENMDWFQATRFCQWLTRVGALPAGWMACLPTEAEWEYACRAGTETEYHTGDGEAALAEAGWYDANSGNKTHPVGKLAPNDWGLHDMHGNVWEWCHDRFDEHRYAKLADGAHDPGFAERAADYRAERGFERSEDDPRRVLRGGSWFFSAVFCRSAVRYWIGAGYRDRSLGFRPVLVPGPVVQPERGARGKGTAEPATGDGGRGTSPEAEGAGGALDLSKERTPRSGRKFF